MKRIKNPNFNRNPRGRGGFREHPENRSPGGWDKNNSISYWLHYFLELSVSEFRKFEERNPEHSRTVAQSIAYARVFNARSSLKECIEITNRTEGYPKQQTEIIETDPVDEMSNEELNATMVDFLMGQYQFGYLKIYDLQNREVKISRIEFVSLTKEQIRSRRPNIIPTQMVEGSHQD